MIGCKGVAPGIGPRFMNPIANDSCVAYAGTFTPANDFFGNKDEFSRKNSCSADASASGSERRTQNLRHGSTFQKTCFPRLVPAFTRE